MSIQHVLTLFSISGGSRQASFLPSLRALLASQHVGESRALIKEVSEPGSLFTYLYLSTDMFSTAQADNYSRLVTEVVSSLADAVDGGECGEQPGGRGPGPRHDGPRAQLLPMRTGRGPISHIISFII